jgi:DNA repair exonuclease SbcCD ATPase subunit
MILRGLRVENWRCIRELALGDLPEGIIVLHGPNRTGKSSLVLALRECLFDSDHDSSRKEIILSAPWGVAEPPKVIVEFQTGGLNYRLTKVFSNKKKEGFALLEKRVDGAWAVDQNAPKEASRRARELLGGEESKSTSGLNQLLWLTQGVLALPVKKLDGSLERKLVDVLGVMVTGHDLEFKQELDARSAKLFTEGGKNKKSSPITLLAENCQNRRAERDKQRDEHAKWEGDLQELQMCLDTRPALEGEVEKARVEVEQLDREFARSQNRIQKFRDAQHDTKDAEASLQRAETALTQLREARQRHRDALAQLAVAEERFEATHRKLADCTQNHNEKLGQLESARVAEATHRTARDELVDRRKLLELMEERAQLDKDLAAAGDLEREIKELEEKLSRVNAPGIDALEELRAHRRKAVELRAQLQAANLNLSVSVEQPSTISIRLDGRPEQVSDCPAGEPQAWSLRQRAVLTIKNLGTVTVARAQEDLDLEEVARELAALDQAFHDAVCLFADNPEDEACLDRLAQRRIERESWSKSLKAARKRLHTLVPEGRGTLETDRDKCDQARKQILEHRPALGDWAPREEDLDERESAFNAAAATLEKTLEDRRKEEQVARAIKENADKAHQEANIQSAECTVEEKNSREALEKLGEELVLLAELERARSALAGAKRTLEENQLTDEERTLGDRSNEAKAALEARRLRLNDLENKLGGLRLLLKDKEGLHIRLADAEAAVLEAETALERAQLEADAHKRLLDLFKESRDDQVERVMGPVAARVLDWSRRIGLSDYHEVCFGDQFLPTGLRRNGDAGSAPSGLDSESYGTGEQLSLLVRLALGGVLAKDEPVVAILDDPLAHADSSKHRRILDVLREASEGNPNWTPPAGRLQIVILTCHPERFDHLPGATQIDLEKLIRRY